MTLKPILYPIVKKLLDEGKVNVVGAMYDLDTGAVDYLK